METILASASPRRAEMLKSLGIPFKVLPQQVDETVLPEEDPETYTLRVAESKTKAALEKLVPWGDCSDPDKEEPIVLAADTVVVVEGRIMGKPRSREEARQMLSALSGRSHHVVTSYWAQRGDGTCQNGTVKTRVRFRVLRPQEVESYLDTAEWRDKAGSYGIQGHAAFMVEELQGSYTNVVGLPLSQVTEALWDLGALSTLPGRPEDDKAPSDPPDKEKEM